MAITKQRLQAQSAAVTSVLTPTHGINVVLDQRQLSSSVPLMFPVFEVWVSSQRQGEVEAYALQGQTGMVESLLARHC